MGRGISVGRNWLIRMTQLPLSLRQKVLAVELGASPKLIRCQTNSNMWLAILLTTAGLLRLASPKILQNPIRI